MITATLYGTTIMIHAYTIAVGPSLLDDLQAWLTQIRFVHEGIRERIGIRYFCGIIPFILCVLKPAGNEE
ncbi:hypothetical protein BWI93_23450 [Siphonobacter sp. BAB-5385]|uniref:hypothetical protein n=1 Tax=Siphonobacter sp. BAB-5385 TaxID=1864822 RepID=UPI000B9DD39B|nr:hypothetical protein [Siphonobacter sp. BAB-5385]OZI05855.1 hypothetical protein BWI93_23450 [Siphonobacter sp. BAB-5385]